MSDFADSVYKVVEGIQSGQVMTYKEVADLAGYPNTCRAVGSLMKKNYDPAVPCHRVVRSNGFVGDYNRGTKLKIEKLRAEGVKIVAGRCLKDECNFPILPAITLDAPDSHTASASKSLSVRALYL